MKYEDGGPQMGPQNAGRSFTPGTDLADSSLHRITDEIPLSSSHIILPLHPASAITN